MNTSCSYCYAICEGLEVVTVCSVCQRRAYCSRKCQIADWRLGHKFWCNKSGERSVDYEIRKSHDRGLGVFALRPFGTGDTIMAERSLMKTDLDVPSVRSAILDLMPHDTEDIEAKFSLNSIGIGASSNECHIFLHMSRVNHHCTGNADHYYISEHGVKILTTCRAIQAGEEITFSYINFMTHPQYYPYLEKKWKFVCNCSACADGSVFYKLMQLQPLDEKITQLGRARQFDEALTFLKNMRRWPPSSLMSARPSMVKLVSAGSPSSNDPPSLLVHSPSIVTVRVLQMTGIILSHDSAFRCAGQQPSVHWLETVTLCAEEDDVLRINIPYMKRIIRGTIVDTWHSFLSSIFKRIYARERVKQIRGPSTR